MSPDDVIRHLVDVVEGIEFERPGDLIDVSGALLALALSREPPERREEMLTRIEDGQLRRDVAQFFEVYAPPARNGNGHAAC